MKCEYCDSIIKPVPDNGICPNCGGVLGEEERRECEALVFPEPPVGVYKDAAGYLEIAQDSVTFYRNQWPIKKSIRQTIAFRDIYAVSYVEARPFMSGSLCVRQWKDRNVPMVSGADAVMDETSVYFRKEKNQIFYQVYLFLKQCEQIVKAAENRKQDSKTALIGKYPCFCGYMEVGEDGVLFYKKMLFAPPITRVICYDEIGEVALAEAKGKHKGALCVRKHGEGKNISKALRHAVADETTIEFSESANDQMRKIYDYLMDCVRENIGS